MDAAVDAIVIVCFFPGPAFWENLVLHRLHAPHIIIVDNASDAATRTRLRELAHEKAIEVIFNEDNLGMAAALNQGIAAARRAGCRYVATFDQDSQPAPHLLPALRQMHAQAMALHGERVVVGAGWLYAGRDNGPLPDWIPEQTLLLDRVPALISSSMYFSLAAADELGPMNERYFIDYVDYEFCLRAKHKGYMLLQSRLPLIVQPFGQPCEYAWRGRRIFLTSYAPLRHYYRVRNLIALARSYWPAERAFLFQEVQYLLRNSAWVLLLDPARLKIAAALLCGAVDGILGRLGAHGKQAAR